MTLAEILIRLLAPAVGRVILKAWFIRDDVAEELTGSIFDIICSRTDDILAQRRATRQFEAIGENIAVSLVPFFEAEGEKLNENGKEAVAIAIAETLDRSQITATLLAKLD